MTTPVRRRTLRARLLGYITAATRGLTAAWGILTAAQRRLLTALAAIRPGRGASARIRAATTAFQRSLAAFDQAAVALVERWAARDLPLIYQDGALTLLGHADRPVGVFRWTRTHQETITATAAQFYTDLMGRIREALRRARAFLRAALDAARNSTGINPQALAAEHPLSTVIYQNEHQHPVHAWAQAAITWQAITTANTGAARCALDDLGCPYVEVRDGPDCGWTTHEDPDRAHRTLRTVADALAHPAAHPNCQREFLPRLDLIGRTDIQSGAPL